MSSTSGQRAVFVLETAVVADLSAAGDSRTVFGRPVRTASLALLFTDPFSLVTCRYFDIFKRISFSFNSI